MAIPEIPGIILTSFNNDGVQVVAYWNGSAFVPLTSVLPSGTTAVTQPNGDDTDLIATDAFVIANGVIVKLVSSLPFSADNGQTVLLTQGVFPGLYSWDSSLGMWRNSAFPNSQSVTFTFTSSNASVNFGYMNTASYSVTILSGSQVPIVALDPGDGLTPILFPAETGTHDLGNMVTYVYESDGTYTATIVGNQIGGTLSMSGDLYGNSPVTNGITYIDISTCPLLGGLDVHSNSLTNLDLSQNASLTNLYCGNNSLAALDLSANPLLTSLDCDTNVLTALSVSANPLLTIVNASYNTGLAALDVSKLTELQLLNIKQTGISSVNLSNCPVLNTLYCDYTNLSTLDLSHNPLMQFLVFGTTLITTINLSANTALEYVECHSSHLTSITIGSSPVLVYLDLSSCSLPSTQVNAILIALSLIDVNSPEFIASLANNYQTYPLVNVSGGTNGAPTGAGATAVTTLTSKGWSVTHN